MYITLNKKHVYIVSYRHSQHLQTLMQTECSFQFFTASIGISVLKTEQIYSGIIFLSPYFRPQKKTIRSKPFVSFHIIFYPRKVIAFYNQNDSHTDYVVSRPPFTYNMHVCHCLLLYMTGFHIQDAHSVFFIATITDRLLSLFTLQIVNLTTRTVEQYNDTPKKDMSRS